MRGLRKRPCLLAAGILAGMLAAGAAHSSKTSRGTVTAPDHHAKKNYSTSVRPSEADPSTHNLYTIDRAELAALRRGRGSAAHRGTIGVPSTPGKSPRFRPATEPEPPFTRIAYAPTSSSREILEALKRRKAIHEGRRKIDPKVVKEATKPQNPVGNEDLIREALAHRGTPYRWGGASRGGFDCSGFAMYVYRRTRGIQLPHSASAQARRGTPVARNDLQPGDLVFFSNGRGIGHVGIYIGDNKFIHAANSRSDVRVDKIEGYYARRYAGARRLSPAPEVPAGEPPPEVAADD